MGILGSLVKTGIVLNQKLSRNPKPGQEQQEDQLRKLLEKAKDTAFGKYYGFSKLLDSENIIRDFRNEVPIHDYNKINNEWWLQQQKYEDITWPGKPDFFALSSGTTGKSSKRIPITEDLLQSIREVGRSLIRYVPDFEFPKEFFESELLMLTSTANLHHHEHGHKEGEISGINVNNFPGWYDLFYRPGKEIASIDNWDERVKKIVEEAPNWNIGAIAGIPSWVLLMLQEIVSAHKLKTIHDIWPNFTAYASGGVAFETYREDFEVIFGKHVVILDTYLASEGFFAHSVRPDNLNMLLALSNGYFYEFIPFDSRGVNEQGEIKDDAEVHSIDQVGKYQDYILVVSSCSGLWRYVIGDTIKFTNIEPHEIKITGRTKFFLNVVGSQLSEEKMDDAIVIVGKEMGISINEYSVAAIKNSNGEYIHQWIIVTNDDVVEEKFMTLLDEQLKETNKNYRVARSKALRGVKVIAISKEKYHEYLEQSKQKGGQLKTPKVMPKEKMEEYLKFLSGELEARESS